MRSFGRAAASARRGLGRAVHRAGGATRSDIRVLARSVDALAARIERLERVQSDIEARLTQSENLAAIDAVSRFIRHVGPRTEPLVSVVLPTCDRPDRLRRAIDSVLAQRYARWELLVVDNGGETGSRAIVEETRDSRLRWMEIGTRGAGVARNKALANTAGEIIAYLDDDNVMDPEWLHAVVWTFEQRPDIEVLYGGIVVDDVLRVKGRASGELPRAFLHTWNREVIRHDNLADMGAIAHRSGLPEARFDESLREMGDWDLLLRLTAERDPLVLPVIACYYTTDAPNRLSGGPTHRADRAKVIDRAAIARR